MDYSPSKLLSGKTIVVTRGEEQGKDSRLLLENAGANVILYPTIGFKMVPLPEMITEQILEGYFDFLFFPSQNAVTYFLQSFHAMHALNIMCTIGAVGVKTAAKLLEAGITVDIVPVEQNAAGILQEMHNRTVSNKRALIISSDISRPELLDGLIALGIHAERVVVYQTTFPPINITHEANDRLKKMHADAFMFTSPSTFKNFLVLAGIHSADYFRGAATVGIGPTTINEMKNFGLKNSLQPEHADFSGMVAVLEEFYKKENEKQVYNEKVTE